MQINLMDGRSIPDIGFLCQPLIVREKRFRPTKVRLLWVINHDRVFTFGFNALSDGSVCVAFQRKEMASSAEAIDAIST